MNTVLCQDVQEWLARRNSAEISLPPSLELCEHVVNCASCRAFLLLLMTELFDIPLSIRPISCSQCQQDLAAYIDIVRHEGQQAAISEYAHVWWHLWFCTDCAEMYHMVTTLQGFEKTAVAAPLAALKQNIASQPRKKTRPVIAAFTLPRVWFARMLLPQMSTTWGSYDDDTIIHDEDHEEHRINVVMRRQHELWTMIVTVDPPLLGDIVLTIGTQTFRQTLRPDGTAMIDSLPSELLFDTAGPGIALVLEPAM